MFCLSLLLLLLLFSLFVCYSEARENITDVITFNNTVDGKYFVMKNLYLYRAKLYDYEINNPDKYASQFRGNVQDVCETHEDLPIVKALNCKVTTEFLDFEGSSLWDYMVHMGIDPLSPVYAAPEIAQNTEYTNPEEYPYLGIFQSIVMEKTFRVSLQEVGLLPKYSTFWCGKGCNNWTIGKKAKGTVCSSKFAWDFILPKKKRCNKLINLLCLCVPS